VTVYKNVGLMAVNKYNVFRQVFPFLELRLAQTVVTIPLNGPMWWGGGGLSRNFNYAFGKLV
jgi:hypothetical protein